VALVAAAPVVAVRAEVGNLIQLKKIKNRIIAGFDILKN
jgi:hypothetical protein